MGNNNVDAMPTCSWFIRQDTDLDPVYVTSCWKEFIFTADGITENGFQFCCFCGKSIKETDGPDEPE